MPEPHRRAAHARVAVAVDDGDDQLRRAKGGEMALGRGRRYDMARRPAAACGEEDNANS
jgi:hypothetical protein